MAHYSLQSPSELLQEIGASARRLRLERDLPQAELAARANVAVRTLQRFERTGRAPLEVVVQIAFALGAEAGFAALFPRPDPRTIDDVLAERTPARQRARGKR